MHPFSINSPTLGFDAMGAPYSTYAPYASVMAAFEGAEISGSVDSGSGPRQDVTQRKTIIFRNHPSQSFTPDMVAVEQETGIVFNILAIRYDYRKTTCFMDIESGKSNGGIP